MQTKLRNKKLQACQGFTIAELMVTLVVAATLAGLAAPNMRVFMQNSQLTSAVNEMLRTVQSARTEATKRQKNVVVCISSNIDAATPACDGSMMNGWIVFQDDDGDWERAESEQLISSFTFDATSMNLLADESRRISFAATGFLSPAGANAATQTPSTSMVICDRRGNVTEAGQSVARGLQISPTGRARVTRDVSTIVTLLALTGGACPS